MDQHLITSLLQLWDCSQVNFLTDQNQTLAPFTKGVTKNVLSHLKALEKEVFAG
tara:strand:+ start:241 stop:402 length:162 start_codon:yes stop_codon:yes gene_type:complete